MLSGFIVAGGRWLFGHLYIILTRFGRMMRRKAGGQSVSGQVVLDERVTLSRDATSKHRRNNEWNAATGKENVSPSLH